MRNTKGYLTHLPIQRRWKLININQYPELYCTFIHTWGNDWVLEFMDFEIIIN